jgi:hypothetical protein
VVFLILKIKTFWGIRLLRLREPQASFDATVMSINILKVAEALEATLPRVHEALEAKNLHP